MQGLADEAGMPIAEWAEKRSPRFYQFLSTLSDATGIGKFVAAPVAAEAYVRMPPVRGAIGPVVEAVHGAEFMPAVNDLAEHYDAYQFGEAAARESERMNDAESPVPPVE
jgi:hypothetical protein